MNLWIRKRLGCFPAWNPSVPSKPTPPCRGQVKGEACGLNFLPEGWLIFWNYSPRRMRISSSPPGLFHPFFRIGDSQPKLTFICDWHASWVGGVARVDGTYLSLGAKRCHSHPCGNEESAESRQKGGGVQLSRSKSVPDGFMRQAFRGDPTGCQLGVGILWGWRCFSSNFLEGEGVLKKRNWLLKNLEMKKSPQKNWESSMGIETHHLATQWEAQNLWSLQGGFLQDKTIILVLFEVMGKQVVTQLSRCATTEGYDGIDPDKSH